VRPAHLVAALGTAGTVVAWLASVAAAALPRTYEVTRIDSPVPVNNGVFGRGMASAGDLDGDGIDDLLMPQQTGSPNADGMVFVISGQSGAAIARIDAPDAGGAGSRSGFGSFWVSKVGSRAVASSDLGSCAGGTVGVLCPQNPIGPADNVAEIVVGARGVDANGVDSGRVYIYDGRTRALLKRVDMPPADAAMPNALLRGSGFGRTALNPAGLTACEGNFGVGICPPVSQAVALGDIDGGGRPDLVIGAPQLTESPATAQPGSHCAGRPPATVCEQAGRAYVYRGEEIAGSNPATILDGTGPGQSIRTIKNPDAQGDLTFGVPADNEQLANTLNAVGDLGRCTAPGILPGERCSRLLSTTTADGIPDIVIPSPGTDLPLELPEPGRANAGVAYLIDGATGAVLYTYLHPEPHSGATFGSQLSSHEPAVGDLGNTIAPDLYLPAPIQNTTTVGAGRGYVMNGNFKVGSGGVLMSRLDDPTPAIRGTFGGGAAGAGDLMPGSVTPANELIVGVEGFTSSERNDVHIFNPATERILQSIVDPDAQTGSAFGGAIVPLGDINGDDLLDLAVAAENYTGSVGPAQGRVYILRSDNSPGPPPPPPPPPPAAPQPGPAGPPGPQGTAALTRAGRTLELAASGERLRRGRRLTLRVRLEAFADRRGCEAAQLVRVQRRRPASVTFRTFVTRRTSAGGSLTVRTRPTATYVYRARVSETARCAGAVSNRERVTVRR
jgi:hypothetical protein